MKSQLERAVTGGKAASFDMQKLNAVTNKVYNELFYVTTTNKKLTPTPLHMKRTL
jgi:hypothetical protein